MVTRLNKIGEREIIKRLSGFIGSDITDDCGYIDVGKRYLVITTDIINEKTHIPSGSSFYDIGWHIVAINLSDLASDGAMPAGILLSLGVSRNHKWSDIKNIIRGAVACAKKYRIQIIGGDTKENNILTICGTAFGWVEKNRRLTRRGICVGDIVCVTGVLGKAKLSMIMKKYKGLLRVYPCIAEGLVLSRSGVVTSCMDISDGLASSLYQLSELNNVGFEIHLAQIPICRGIKKISKREGIPVEDFVLYTGGDYELLFTVKNKKYSYLQDIFRQANLRFTAIGKTISTNEIILVKDKKKIKMENMGYEHFVS